MEIYSITIPCPAVRRILISDVAECLKALMRISIGKFVICLLGVIL